MIELSPFTKSVIQMTVNNVMDMFWRGLYRDYQILSEMYAISIWDSFVQVTDFKSPMDEFDMLYDKCMTAIEESKRYNVMPDLSLLDLS